MAKPFWDAEVWPGGRFLGCSGMTSDRHNHGVLRPCARFGVTTAERFYCWQHANKGDEVAVTDQAMFNEDTLRVAIVSVWGPAGAHVDVYDHVVRLAKKVCPHCEGNGWTTEHHPDCPGGGDFCSDECPVQAQCAECNATGLCLTPPVTEDADNNKDPF